MILDYIKIFIFLVEVVYFLLASYVKDLFLY